jgi:hypothetical protein
MINSSSIDEFYVVASEGFSANITEFSDDRTELRNQSDEESADVLPSIPQPPSKRTYGNTKKNFSARKSFFFIFRRSSSIIHGAIN